VSGPRLVTIRPVSPAGPGILALRTDLDTLAPASGSQAGWTAQDRARQLSASVWTGVAPWQLTLPIVLDGYRDLHGSNDHPASVETLVARVESWRRKTTGPKGTGLPALLAISGPVIAPRGVQWVLTGVVYGDRIRDPKTGQRTQQQLTLTLQQYDAPDLVKSPAKKHRQRHGQDH
jgi:hypothetical protein